MGRFFSNMVRVCTCWITYVRDDDNRVFVPFYLIYYLICLHIHLCGCRLHTHIHLIRFPSFVLLKLFNVQLPQIYDVLRYFYISLQA